MFAQSFIHFNRKKRVGESAIIEEKKSVTAEA
jgi:hypothetical protein